MHGEKRKETLCAAERRKRNASDAMETHWPWKILLILHTKNKTQRRQQAPRLTQSSSHKNISACFSFFDSRIFNYGFSLFLGGVNIGRWDGSWFVSFSLIWEIKSSPILGQLHKTHFRIVYKKVCVAYQSHIRPNRSAFKDKKWFTTWFFIWKI